MFKDVEKTKKKKEKNVCAVFKKRKLCGTLNTNISGLVRCISFLVGSNLNRVIPLKDILKTQFPNGFE